MMEQVEERSTQLTGFVDIAQFLEAPVYLNDLNHLKPLANHFAL